MSWIAELLAHFGFIRQLPTSEENRRARRFRKTTEKADKVIDILEDYGRQDVALKIVVKKR